MNAAFLDEPPAISGEKTLSEVGSLGPRLVWSPAGAALAWYYRSVDPTQWQVLFQLLDANLDRQLATDVVVDTLPDSPDPTLTDLTGPALRRGIGTWVGGCLLLRTPRFWRRGDGW